MNRSTPLLATLLLAACGATPAQPPPQAEAPIASAPAPDPAPAEEVAPFKVLAESFADVHILRYRVPGFESLTPKQKELLYYLYEAAQSGRDIIYDQKCAHNLAVRRTLEAIQASYAGDRQDPDFAHVTTYTKQVWFARGIHHDYSSAKFTPQFSKESFARFVQGADPKLLPLDPPKGKTKPRTVDELVAYLTPVLFDPKVAPVRVNRDKGIDVILGSSANFYEGVTQKEVEDFYKAKQDKADPRPVSFGLNSKLVKERGRLVEKVWRVGGMYGAAIEKIVGWLEKASSVAENPLQKDALDKLITFYKSGDLKDFDAYNIAWVKDTDSRIDVVNGFIETYGDPLGYRATFESVVSIRDLERSKRIATIGAAASWFEKHSPIAEKHKKDKVVGISAKVITVVAEAGDTAPTTPIGINLPNSSWIRKEHGSKSVFLGNIVDANQEVLKDSGIVEEFSESPAEIARAKAYGGLGFSLKVDMHEVIGHASGQLEPGVGTTNETLKNYASALEEARADLVALYYVMDPKLIELGVMPSLEVGKAAYDGYILNGLLVQLARIEPGDSIVQSHMRNRAMVSQWAFEKGRAEKVIERVERDGKIFFVIRDYDKLRALWGQLLAEVQRIKSTGDFEAGKALIEDYGVKVDRTIHDNVLARYRKLGGKPYSGFIQPRLVPVMQGDEMTDVRIEYPTDFAAQMLELSAKYAYLPIHNE